MNVSLDTFSYTVPPDERGYYDLAEAIMAMAINDYRVAIKQNREEDLKSLKRFFLSEVFENLSGVTNPNLFLQRLDEQIEEEVKTGVKRKRKKATLKCNG